MVEKTYRLIHLIAICVWCAIIINASHAFAESDGGITLITDSETQSYLAKVIRPLYNSAHISFDENKIFIVEDPSLNAFVGNNNNMFVNTGTLINVKNTNELAGVLAHETGHIMGGHILRKKIKLKNMQYAMLGSVVAAGAAAISTGRGDAAMAVIMGSQSSAINNMLSHQVEEERNADESAVKILTDTKQSTDGLKNFMTRIKQQNTLQGIKETDYFRNHPLTSERISHFEETAKNNHFSSTSSLDSEFKFVQAKLTAFLQPLPKVWNTYPKNRTDEPAMYAHSIAYFREGDIEKAFSLINTLAENHRSNPYFYEIKGQFLFETGKINESISAYRKALELNPSSYLVQISLAQSLLETEDKANIEEAIKLLNQSVITNPTALAWQMLAKAYGLSGNYAYSYYSTAEFAYAIDDIMLTEKMLEKAKKQTPTNQLKLKIEDLEDRVAENKENNKI